MAVPRSSISSNQVVSPACCGPCSSLPSLWDHFTTTIYSEHRWRQLAYHSILSMCLSVPTIHSRKTLLLQNLPAALLRPCSSERNKQTRKSEQSISPVQRPLRDSFVTGVLLSTYRHSPRFAAGVILLLNTESARATRAFEISEGERKGEIRRVCELQTSPLDKPLTRD